MKPKTTLAYTLPLILAPILYGIAVYQQLPAQVAIHWGVNNTPDGFAARPLLVFGIPLLMVIIQLITIFSLSKSPQAPRFERVIIWIIPAITLVAYMASIAFNLGHQVDIRRIVVVLIAAIFIAMGNYLPTVPVDYQARYTWPKPKKTSKRANRYTGIAMVITGIAMLLSLFAPPIASAVVLGIAIVAILATAFVK